MFLALACENGVNNYNQHIVHVYIQHKRTILLYSMDMECRHMCHYAIIIRESICIALLLLLILLIPIT